MGGIGLDDINVVFLDGNGKEDSPQGKGEGVDRDDPKATSSEREDEEDDIDEMESATIGVPKMEARMALTT